MGLLKKYYHKKGPPPPNFFIGGVSSVLSTVALTASELGVSFYKVKNFQIDGDDISFHIPSPFNQAGQKWKNMSLLTYFYDVDGNMNYVPIEMFRDATNLKKIWLPNVLWLDGPSGWKTFDNTGVEGFVIMDSLTGTVGGYENEKMNFIFNGSNITHLKYKNLTDLQTQWQNANARYTHQNITTLERLYLPVLSYIDGYDDLTQSVRNFNNIPASAVVYISPFLETNRLAETYVRTIGTQHGDTVTLNGLVYSATTGSTTSTAFNISGTDIQKATNLSTSINSDSRTGTLGDLTTRHQYNANWILIKQTLSGTTGNTTTFSVSNATRLVTPVGGTFSYGGGPDRSVAYWLNRGCDVRYVTGTTTPDAIVDLSGTNITTTTIDLVFTPPASVDRPLDFYEVWVDDGVNSGSTIWQTLVPHQEISGSGSAVTDLLSGTTYTFRVKAADTLYNVSDFSNTFTGTTS